jgi:hypothetical protein
MGLMENPETVWKVKTKDGEGVELSSATLLDALLGKVLQTPKQDFDELIVTFGKFLQTRDLFGDMKFNQLIGMSFAVGYFYRVFLEKNDVEITITDASNANADINTDNTSDDNVDTTTEEETSNISEEIENAQMVSELTSNASSEEGGSPNS